MIDQAKYARLLAGTDEGLMTTVSLNSKTGCWDSSRPVNWRHQYPRVRRAGRCSPAHRVSFDFFVGPIPDGMFILHSCDNKRCVSPTHLRAGTHAENMIDMKSRFGRRRWTEGASNPKAKLTDLQVLEIRRVHARGASINSLAIISGLSAQAISRIVRHKGWRVLRSQ